MLAVLALTGGIGLIVYGMGWLVRNTPGNWWHDGALRRARTAHLAVTKTKNTESQRGSQQPKTKPKHRATEVTEITEKVWKKSSRRAKKPRIISTVGSAVQRVQRKATF